MLSWLKSWWYRPTAVKPEEEKKKIVLLPGKHTLSPYRLLEWFRQPAVLDPLPPYPPSPRKYPSDKV
jgi:hypothetical protein